MRFDDKLKGTLVLGYSGIHYLVFGFDVWLAVLLVLGLFFTIKGLLYKKGNT